MKVTIIARLIQSVTSEGVQACKYQRIIIGDMIFSWPHYYFFSLQNRMFCVVWVLQWFTFNYRFVRNIIYFIVYVYIHFILYVFCKVSCYIDSVIVGGRRYSPASYSRYLNERFLGKNNVVPIDFWEQNRLSTKTELRNQFPIWFLYQISWYSIKVAHFKGFVENTVN